MPSALGALFGAGSPLAGNLGVVTASFFALDPTSTVPVEPVLDLIPGITPFRITVDTIDSENKTKTARVTKNSLQDFSDTTPNVHLELQTLSITGTISANGPFGPGGAPPPTGAAGFRSDLLRINNLERLMEARRPIMVVTPRVSLAKCFIQSISRPWTPADGESIVVTVNLIEARIVSPISIGALPDTDSMAAGNNSTTGGGEQATAVAERPATPSNVPNTGGTLGGAPQW